MLSQQRCVWTIFHDHCCQRRRDSPHMQTGSCVVRLQHDHNIVRILLRGTPPHKPLPQTRVSALCTCSHPFDLVLGMHRALLLAGAHGDLLMLAAGTCTTGSDSDRPEVAALHWGREKSRSGERFSSAGHNDEAAGRPPAPLLPRHSIHASVRGSRGSNSIWLCAGQWQG